MRIGVIGAGSVGGTIAALLDRGGHQIEVTARGEHLAAIRRHGLSLEGAWGTHVAKVEANPILTAAPDLVLLTTKALDAQSALEENSKLIVGVPLVVVQNGLDGLRIASQVLPSSTPVGALAVFAASYLAPGSVAVTTPGSTYLGSASNGPEVEFAAGILEMVMPTKVIRNFPGAQWTKLLVNQINALPAITGLSAQETISIRGLRLVLTRSLKEAARIGF
ncbi:MAG: NAD(P)-binding domain-containing protein, partial [Cryobacterium sp.]|nr:NAD(P)-binding domain-containing protein [Cryobacterium sp.]